MRTWFQNLKREDREKRLFNFRGSFSRDGRHGSFLTYQIASGRALKFEYTHGEAGSDGDGSQLVLGLLFFTAYIGFAFPDRWYFKKKCIATWDNNREFYLVDGRRYGFYFHDWSFVWNWHSKVNESSSTDPWWMHQYWHLDQWLLGKPEIVTRKIYDSENLKFRMGSKEFLMDSVEWERITRFRTFIPFALYNRSYIRVDMEIKNPPMRAGKGENSWDIDDDGSFGLCMEWKHAAPTWNNKREMERLAVLDYVNNTQKSARKYGSGSGEHGISYSDTFEFIGRTDLKKSTEAQAAP